MRHTKLRRTFLLLTIFAVLSFGPAGPASAGPMVADPLTQVSGLSPFAPGCNGAPQSGTLHPNSEVEPWIAANPADPNNLAGAWQQDRWSTGGANGLLAGVSKDGGQTWKSVVIPGISRCSGGTAANGGDYERATDPWVTFAPNGHLYQISLSFNDSNPTNGILVSKSTDGGDTWGPTTTLIRDTDANFFNDKQSITADPHDSNFVYAAWDRLVFPTGRASAAAAEHAVAYRGPLYFSRTTDGGQTWEPARSIYDPGTLNQVIGVQIVVLPSGELVAVFDLIYNAKNAKGVRGLNVAVIRSTDKGATWSKPIIIDKLATIGVTDPESGKPVRTGDIIPEIGVAPNGTLYVVWQDARASGFAHDEVFLSVSTDKGLTWSAPVKVNQTPANIAAGNQQAFTPSVEVAADGTVGVTYYDFRHNDAGGDLKTDYFIVHCHPTTPAACANPGNWGGEVKLTDTSFDMRAAPFAFGYFVGDYEGLATAGSDFLTFFSQSHTGDPASIFFRRVGP